MKKTIWMGIFFGGLLLTLPANAQKILFSFDKETGTEPTEFLREGRWVNGGGDAAGTMEIVKAHDHANGGKALKITRKNGLANFSRLRVQTKNLNFKPGITCRVSGWFKGDREGLAQIQLTSPWAKNKKQWYKPIDFRVGKEWRRYSFEFIVPEASANSTLTSGKLYLTFGLFQNSLKELYAKDILWEVKK